MIVDDVKSSVDLAELSVGPDFVSHAIAQGRSTRDVWRSKKLGEIIGNTISMRPVVMRNVLLLELADCRESTDKRTCELHAYLSTRANCSQLGLRTRLFCPVEIVGQRRKLFET